MERKIKWFVYEHYFTYTVPDLFLKFLMTFGIGFLVAPFIKLTELEYSDSINFFDENLIPLVVGVGVMAAIFSIIYVILFVINKKWSLLEIRSFLGLYASICSFMGSSFTWKNEQLKIDNVPIFVLGIIVCLLCGFLYFIFLIKKYIPNVQVGQDNESSKSMMFAAPAFVMAVRPILLSFSPIPTIQFLIYGVSCATFVMAVEWGTRAYLAKLYNLK